MLEQFFWLEKHRSSRLEKKDKFVAPEPPEAHFWAACVKAVACRQYSKMIALPNQDTASKPNQHAWVVILQAPYRNRIVAKRVNQEIHKAARQISYFDYLGVHGRHHMPSVLRQQR
jgi:hypothetical protein